ncbi:hypothetical protein E2562_038517 [Oryza meyeriana var. granulata]|uniref:Uncharacterized protein n=1 Tax=Oryza meyeriana var. granulata TaxID=110450 RepID=A0A6G1CNK8_9ORYZ|nr:hypothetical protein E2562_038517 [Oryza meyeriana var. granulata]
MPSNPCDAASQLNQPEAPCPGAVALRGLRKICKTHFWNGKMPSKPYNVAGWLNQPEALCGGAVALRGLRITS